MKKNIIFPIEFNHLTGGMIHSVISLIKTLSSDYEVYILVHEEAEIAQLKLNATPLFLKKPWSISMGSPMKTIKTSLEVRKLLKPFDKKDTLIFTNNSGSEMIFSGFGFFPISIRRVFVSRGGDYNGKTGAILKRGFKSVFKFIAISESQRKKLTKVNRRPEETIVIHNGMNIKNDSNFKYDAEKPIMELSIVGYLNENKNQLLAIRALSELVKQNQNIKLNIYGVAFSPSDKVYEEKLLREIEKLNLENQVVFKGFEEDQFKLYKSTDILISCSLSEGFGRSVVEAMSLGIPCIGLEQSGGLVDIITNNEDGFLIKNDVTELCSVVLSLIKNNELRKRISEKATLTYSEKFTEEKMCKKYNSFIKENI